MSRTTLNEVLVAPPGAGGMFTPFTLIPGDATSAAATTLSSSATISATTWSFTASTGFNVNDFVMCGNEIAVITAITGSGPYTVTVTRAQFGTQAEPHASSAPVTSLMFGNRFVPTQDYDCILALNTDSSVHNLTLRGPQGIATYEIPASGYVITGSLPRNIWQIAGDSNAIWFNVTDATVKVAVLQQP